MISIFSLMWLHSQASCWPASASASSAARGKHGKPVPLDFRCLCGSAQCHPPDPKQCDVLSCCGKISAVRFSGKTACWLAQCSNSVAHKQVFAYGHWTGNGCQRGVGKAGVVMVAGHNDYDESWQWWEWWFREFREIDDTEGTVISVMFMLIMFIEN